MASELIKRLQETIDTHGDLPVAAASTFGEHTTALSLSLRPFDIEPQVLHATSFGGLWLPTAATDEYVYPYHLLIHARVPNEVAEYRLAAQRTETIGGGDDAEMKAHADKTPMGFR